MTLIPSLMVAVVVKESSTSKCHAIEMHMCFFCKIEAVFKSGGLLAFEKSCQQIC